MYQLSSLAGISKNRTYKILPKPSDILNYMYRCHYNLFGAGTQTIPAGAFTRGNKLCKREQDFPHLVSYNDLIQEELTAA